jgi:hypothetical protein
MLFENIGELKVANFARERGRLLGKNRGNVLDGYRRTTSHSDTPAVVIVGARQARFQAAVSLREGGYPGKISVFGDEPELPYQRPSAFEGDPA